MTIILTKKIFSLKKLVAKDISDYPAKTNLSAFQKASLQWLGDIIRPSRSRAFWDGGRYMWWHPEGAGNKGGYLTKDNEAMYFDEGTGEVFAVTDFVLDMPRTNATGTLIYKTT